MVDPKRKSITRNSVLVFMRRFLPAEVNIYPQDADAVFRYFGNDKKEELHFDQIKNLIYPGGYEEIEYIDSFMEPPNFR